MNVEEFAELVEKANKANDESVCVFFGTLKQALTENGVIS